MRSTRQLMRKVANLAVPLVLMALAVGCSDDDDENPMAPDPGESFVRALHLSPDSPAVDVFLGSGPPAVEDLMFPSGTGYLTVEAGTYDLAVSAAGMGAGSAVLTVPGLRLDEGVRYTAVAFDNLLSIQALALVDDLSSPGAGNIRVRAIHTAVGVGEVDIWNVPASGDPAPLYTDVDFGDAGDFLTIPAGAYRLGIDIDDDMVPDLLYSLPSLPAGTVANVFAVNDGVDVFLLAQLGDGSTVRVNADGPSPISAELRSAFGGERLERRP